MTAAQPTPSPDDLRDPDWSRQQWLGYADRLLASAARYASPGRARITLPGAEGGYGRAVDGLEGFARTFLLAGFRVAGERGVGVEPLIDFYARGIAAGVDPAADDRWVRPDEHPQAKVEAASLALILDLTRPWLWDRLDAVTQRRMIDYLSPAVGDDSYPPTNWLWFRLVVQTFLRSVGGPWSSADVAADLALHDSLIRADGWLSDGPERSYDHYVGWALHLYPTLWARMRGASELAGDRTEADVARLDRFLLDAVHLIGADGSPLIQGRSLIYRFAAAAPFWVGALAGVPSTSLGALRHAANRVVGHFAAHGVPNADGLLTMGWHHDWRTLAQSYSGPGSPYWATKGLLGVALPADHPVWTAPAEPLPVEARDTLGVVRAAGWVVSGTRADGIVRVINHGTDHALETTLVGDSPLYARLGYSTRTAPLLDPCAWREPLEQSVALLDAAGNATHRAAMELVDVRVQDGRVGIASSTWLAHWIAPSTTQIGHGSGITGRTTLAGRITAHSLVRGAWEVRLARVDTLEPGVEADAVTLRIGGWALSGTEVDESVGADTARVTAGATTAGVRALTGNGRPAVERRTDAGPLGPVSAVGYLDFPVGVGGWTVALIDLSGAEAPTPEESRILVGRTRRDLGSTALTRVSTGSTNDHEATASDQTAASAEITGDTDHPEVRVRWPDGLRTVSRLMNVRSAAAAER